MPIEDVYSNRNKPLPEYLNYDNLPVKFKNQIVHIWGDFFEYITNDDIHNEIWEVIEGKIAKEHGKKSLIDSGLLRYKDSYKVESYFLDNDNVEECLDIIEIVFKVINKAGELYHLKHESAIACKDLNSRFLQNGIGYQMASGIIIKVDSTLLHQTITQPALNLLENKQYENSNEEFLKAHEHFRNGRNKECLNECLKAFETTMKIICNLNKWSFGEGDTASKLINVLTSNNFFPDYHSTHLNAVKQILESGVPTIRNKNAAHGQGVTKITVDNEMANYMLNITGSVIKFIVDVQNTRSEKISQ